MGVELFEKIIDEGEFFASPTVLHWLGEPLMDPNFFDLIPIAKRKIANLGISTNATLLNDANQDRLLDSKLDTILISIDGDTKEVYESVRKSVRFSFERVVSNVESFLAKRRARGQKSPHVTLSIIVMEKTAPDVDRFRQHWIDKGADEIRIKEFVNWAGQEEGIFNQYGSSADKAKFMSRQNHSCKFLWDNVVIAWDGTVVPCCFDYDAKLVMGNLKTETLSEIWNGPAYVELRRAELEGRNNAEPCKSCTQRPGWQCDRERNCIPQSKLSGWKSRFKSVMRKTA